MEQVLTLVCKLQPTLEQSNKINALLASFADGCNWTNETVKPLVTSKTTIQNLVYQTLREQFGLSANQAVRVCARVGANRKTAKLNQRKASEGTRSSRRRCRGLLQRLSEKERCYQSWLNHNISKYIVLDALASAAIIAILKPS